MQHADLERLIKAYDLALTIGTAQSKSELRGGLVELQS